MVRPVRVTKDADGSLNLIREDLETKAPKPRPFVRRYAKNIAAVATFWMIIATIGLVLWTGNGMVLGWIVLGVVALVVIIYVSLMIFVMADQL